MATQANGDPGTGSAVRSSEKSAIGRLAAHVAPILGGKITGGVIVGALIALTGFGPEHWFAVAFERMRLTQAIAAVQSFGLDFRVLLVAVGVAIVAVDVFRRERKLTPTSEGALSAESSTAKTSLPSAELIAAAPPLSLVVLPFRNLSDEPDQDYFVDGLVDDLTTELSRLAGAFVIARNTAFTFKGKSVDIKAATRELGVLYALEGSVRRSENVIRVTAQLVDGASGATIWAEKFDQKKEDLLQLQDAIVGDLAATLNVRLIEAESRRSAQAPNPTAVDLVMQAKAQMNNRFEPAAIKNAMELFDAARQLDPENVEAIAGYVVAAGYYGQTSSVSAAAAEAARCEAIARRGVELAPNNARSRTALGLTLRHLGRHEESAREYDEAIRADSNYLPARNGAAVTQIALGNLDAAEMHLKKAARLSPRDPYMFNIYGSLGSVQFARDNYEAAIDDATKAIAANSSWPAAHILLISSLGKLGRTAEAQRAVAAYSSVRTGPKTISEVRATLPSIYGCEPRFAPELYEGMRLAGCLDERQ